MRSLSSIKLEKKSHLSGGIKAQYGEIKYQHKISDKQILLLLNEAKQDSVSKIVVGGVIVNKDNKALVVKRATKEDFLPGLLEFPSGHLEKDESLLDGLVREIKEETSYEDILVENYINCFDYTSRSGKKVRQFNFLVKLNYNKQPILNEEEHQSYYWCSYKEAVIIGTDETVLNSLKIIFNVS